MSEQRGSFFEFTLNYLPNHLELSVRFCTLRDLLLSALPQFSAVLILLEGLEGV